VLYSSSDKKNLDAFKYKFFPKNKTESDAVYNIINTFKFHMHPDMSDGKFFRASQPDKGWPTASINRHERRMGLPIFEFEEK
jgi:hypothetical protein